MVPPLSLSRNGNTFELLGRQGGFVLQTTGPGELPKVIDLEEGFPLTLYDGLKRAINSRATYDSIHFRREDVARALMIIPVRDWIYLHWSDIHWMGLHRPEEIGPLSMFMICLRDSEVGELLEYVDANMTCC